MIDGPHVTSIDALTTLNGEKPEAPFRWKRLKGSGRIEYLFDRHQRQVFRAASAVFRDTTDPTREAGR